MKARLFGCTSWSHIFSGEIINIYRHGCLNRILSHGLDGWCRRFSLTTWKLDNNWRIYCVVCCIATKARMICWRTLLWWYDCRWDVTSLRLEASALTSSTTRPLLLFDLAVDKLYQESPIPMESHFSADVLWWCGWKDKLFNISD